MLGEDAKIVREFAGSELVGRVYEPLFECTAKAAAKTGKKGFRNDGVSDGLAVYRLADRR